jgi:hypothetical protein
VRKGRREETAEEKKNKGKKTENNIVRNTMP